MPFTMQNGYNMQVNLLVTLVLKTLTIQHEGGQ